jgi:hypothetical protein
MTFRRSLEARPVIVRGEHCAGGAVACGSYWDNDAGAPAIGDHAHSLPEICQKPRYANPRVAPQSNPWRPLLPARLRGNVGRRRALRTTRSSMACKASGVQIPSASPRSEARSGLGRPRIVRPRQHIGSNGSRPASPAGSNAGSCSSDCSRPPADRASPGTPVVIRPAAGHAGLVAKNR